MDYTKNLKLRIIIVFTALFLAVSTLLLLIFFAGKKSYTVTFDLNGGTLLSGSLTQHVTRGQNATPPKTVKEGAYFLEWSESYREITRDIVIEAIWEYETTPGIIYIDDENKNYTEIIGSYKYISGDVYIGAYHNSKKLLGIKSGAFSGCINITKVYLLDGLLCIEERAFFECTSLKEIEIPETVSRIEKEAFLNCESLEKLVLHNGLTEIGEGAFSGCSALKEVVIPQSVTKIDKNAFSGCEDLIIKVTFSEADKPDGWSDGWQGSSKVVWDAEIPSAEENKDNESSR